jgi:cell division septation protein DedD
MGNIILPMEQLNPNAMRQLHPLQRFLTATLIATLAACTQVPLAEQPPETPVQLQSESALAPPVASTAPATCKDCESAAVPTATPIERNSAQPTPLESAPVATAPAAATPPQPAAAPPKPAVAPAATKKGTVPKIAKATGELAHGYYLNVGVFAVSANADKVVQKLQGAGFKPIVQELTTSKGHVTRVRVGPFGTKADAAQTAKKIRALKLDAVVFKH